jgi:hypothetical protein
MRIALAAVALFAVSTVTAPALADDIPETFQSDTSGALPPGLDFKTVTGKDAGKVERVVSWNEGDGAHVAVFASTEKEGQKGGENWYSKVLYVTTFQVRDGKYTLVRAVKEAVQPCQFDLTARFLDASVSLTNIDEDDQGELTFAYVTTCTSDVSPLSMKLLMLEGKTKYALRGESRVHLGDEEYMGGEFKPDFKGAPKGFLEHAKRVWSANVNGR